MGGGIGPLGLVDPWIGYRVFKKKKKKFQPNPADYNANQVVEQALNKLG